MLGSSSQLLAKLMSLAADFIPLLVTLALVAATFALVRWLRERRTNLSTESRLPWQLGFIVLLICSVISIILAIPVTPDTRSDLLSLFGLLLTGVIGLSSTTFVANAMAGLMLSSVKSFGHGDFVKAGDFFGRVTERGLFHTEIQSENRDLITLPNLYLASNPLTVTRSSGTIIYCELSLGYDVAHYDVEPLLLEAAEAVGLKDPFVRLMSLGDFSVVYRACGYLEDIKHLLTARSRLHEQVLDSLHGGGIEIVSPNFMNQRQFHKEDVFISAPCREQEKEQQQTPESLIFDKADRAEKIDTLKDEIRQLKTELDHYKSELDGAVDDQKGDIKQEIHAREKRIKSLTNIITKANEKTDD